MIAIAHALLSWPVIGPLAILVLQRALVPLLERAARRFTAPAAAA